MIILEEQHFIGKGGNRECYENPDCSDECIKLNLKEKSNGLKRLRRELKELKRLEKKWHGISQVSGFRREVETNLGRGHVYDLIRDQDGTISNTLEDYFFGKVESDFSRGDFLCLIHDLYKVCKANHYIVYELNEDNVVLQRLEGEDRLVIIDGMGNSDVIKICNYSRFFAHKKLDRKVGVLLKRLGVCKSEMAF